MVLRLRSVVIDPLESRRTASTTKNHSHASLTSIVAPRQPMTGTTSASSSFVCIKANIMLDNPHRKRCWSASALVVQQMVNNHNCLFKHNTHSSSFFLSLN